MRWQVHVSPPHIHKTLLWFDKNNKLKKKNKIKNKSINLPLALGSVGQLKLNKPLAFISIMSWRDSAWIRVHLYRQSLGCDGPGGSTSFRHRHSQLFRRRSFDSPLALLLHAVQCNRHPYHPYINYPDAGHKKPVQKCENHIFFL